MNQHESFGQLALTYAGIHLPLEVLCSGAGYYIGTRDAEGPVSRESEYFPTSAEAQRAFDEGSWTQRPNP
ncbi:hypothetical protein CNQ84_13965 [Pseudomonas abyssi]|uniref:Uncharacterized protein n=1 Tax=Pseudomonas abyssi TaxID=170540 RepID=A0A2A3MFS7_9PSED|nr:hypothetical protein [Pseudomonas abyssi]PBK03676.1 hypothetical protein CNQ84_13965 [Pseudomonas abyssi]